MRKKRILYVEPHDVIQAVLPSALRTGKAAQRESFGTDILRTSGGHSGGRPGSKPSGEISNPWKSSIWLGTSMS